MVNNNVLSTKLMRKRNRFTGHTQTKQTIIVENFCKEIRLLIFFKDIQIDTEKIIKKIYSSNIFRQCCSRSLFFQSVRCKTTYQIDIKSQFTPLKCSFLGFQVYLSTFEIDAIGNICLFMINVYINIQFNASKVILASNQIYNCLKP